ncbi:MAG: divergent polysaccharide deacetylase family protein [bacterium]|nr:divergent polysaccharide deacetylase family protein [bacterium]
MTRTTRRRRAAGNGWLKTLLLTGAAIMFAAGIYLGVELAKPPPRPDFGPAPAPSVDPAPGAAEPPAAGPLSTPPSPTPPELEIARQPPPGGNRRPRISIVIDDLGRSLSDLDILADLAVPLTYSVLPFESHTPQVVAELRRRRAEILCHLPMEAKGGANPGPGALLLSMSDEQLAEATRRALAAVPGAAGVNNHMGSGLLARRDAATTVLSVLAEQKLYFLDSRTSADTLGYSLARHLGLPAGERQVFLDTHRDRAFIRDQFAALLAAARERGGATAIAHPYPETLELLAAEIPAARAQGFEFVTASALLEG